MICANCRRENPADDRFCGGCGAPLPRACPACGRPTPPGDAFCGGCGQAFESPAQPNRYVPVHSDPRAYTPKHLAEKILASKSALEGERKQVTVLFADVKGSLELAEQVDPEEWHRILNRFFEILTDGVHRFEGTVNQYTGDGIMALFGAPIAHEDHAHRACYAALRLQSELQRYARSLRLERGLDFAVRMGINSGEVIVGKIGDDLRMDYTAQGHTVGLAARLEQLAEAGKIYLTEHTASLVAGFFQTEELGPVQAKGVRDAVRVFELQGVGPMRTRLDVSRARGLTHFVGREQEMATLEAALDSAVRGSGRVVGVVAEPGTGKSRLCFEFLEKCRARGIGVREAHALPHGKSIPFVTILEFMRDFFGITERDRDEEARHKIAGRVLLLDEALKEELPILFEFLGVPDPKRPAPAADAEERRKRLIALFRKIIQARSREEPGVSLFEDLHWIDRGSESFLENMMETVAGTRTVLLLTFRPEYRAEWMEKMFYHQIPLLPLGPGAIAEMLRDLLGEDPGLSNLPARIASHTGGNPFFVEEVVQSLVEGGSLEGKRGAYRLVNPVEGLWLPPTVQAVLAARIDRLPEREKQLLSTAAVIGKTFAGPLLARVANLPEIDLASALHALMRSEFVFQESLYPEAEYAFKHPLTQEVAYRSQLSERRAGVHGEVALALEEIHGEKSGEHAALLAHHWEQAGERLAAARWHARAATWIRFNHPEETLQHWRRVRELLREVEESPEALALGSQAVTNILMFGQRIGGIGQEAAALLAEGEDLARRSGDAESRIRLLIGTSIIRVNEGNLGEGLDLMEAARVLADGAGHAGLRVATRALLAGLLSLRGELGAVLSCAEEALGIARGDPDMGADILSHSPLVTIGYARGGALLAQGRFAESRAALERAAALAREREDRFPLIMCLCMQSLVAEFLGEAPQALEHARRGVEMAEQLGADYLRVFGLFTFGWALGLDGRWEESIGRLEESRALCRDRRAGLFLEGYQLAGLSEARLALGDAEEARALAEEAVEMTRRQGLPIAECRALLALARALIASEGAKARGDVEEALARAQSLVETVGYRAGEPFVLVERARLARALGDEGAFRRHLDEARRLFTEMDAPLRAEMLAREFGT